MIRWIYDKTLSLAKTRYALIVLGVVSFMESSFFPIPPDVLLIPMILAAPRRAWYIAMICTLCSVAGGAFGYWIGAVLMDSIGAPILAFYGKEALFAQFQVHYNENGAWAVLAAGLTPFPYKVITITSGATGLDFTLFMICSLIARGARFFILAALLWRFGPPIRAFIERRLGLVFTVAVICLIGGFLAVGYV